MSVLLVSTESSLPFARRLAAHVGVPVAGVERQQFPDGERYLRFALDDRFGLLNQCVVLVGATESGTSLDELFRLLAIAKPRHLPRAGAPCAPPCHT